MKRCKSRSIAKLVEFTALPADAGKLRASVSIAKPAGQVWVRGRTEDVQGNALPSSVGDGGRTVVDAGNLGGSRRPARAEHQQIEIREKSERDAAYAAPHAAFGARSGLDYTQSNGDAGIGD